MDPTNPLRGPRRAARRGKEALRNDRVEAVGGGASAPSGSGSNSFSGSLPGSATATPPSLPFPTDAYQDQFVDDEDSDSDSDIDDHDTSHIPNAHANSPHAHNRHIGGGLMAHMARLRASRLAEAEAEAEQGGRNRGLRHPHRQRPSHPAGHPGYEAYDDDDDDDSEVAAPEIRASMVQVDSDETDDMDDDEFEFAGRERDDSDEEEEDEEGDEDDELHGPGEGEEGDGADDDDDDDDAGISFDPMLLGLKEINNLAHFSVSSHKPGNGVDELLNDDLNKYWQSDGPQPHLLTIHFLRRVEIRAIRFFVDYNQDESYTPTSVVLSAGTGHHDLLEFASLALTTPVGWQDIDLSNVGGGADGQSLCCWIVQVKVKENHQNGKDTHIRGIKLYAMDENAPPADTALDELARIKTRTLQLQQQQQKQLVAGGTDAMIDKDDYLFERLITQPPDKLPGAPERSGSMATFLRDEEIR